MLNFFNDHNGGKKNCIKCWISHATFDTQSDYNWHRQHFVDSDQRISYRDLGQRGKTAENEREKKDCTQREKSKSEANTSSVWFLKKVAHCGFIQILVQLLWDRLVSVDYSLNHICSTFT